MLKGLTNALRGIGGEFEVQRVLGAAGTTVFMVAAPAFVLIGVIDDVSFTEFCLAYPGGLAACIGATAGAIALKDRQVAVAKTISETGAVPTPPPAGPPVPTEPKPEDQL